MAYLKQRLPQLVTLFEGATQCRPSGSEGDARKGCGARADQLPTQGSPYPLSSLPQQRRICLNAQESLPFGAAMLSTKRFQAPFIEEELSVKKLGISLMLAG